LLVKPTDTLDQVLINTKHELRRGALDRKHPFRYASLVTHLEGELGARYVVLRRVNDLIDLFFFTDSRSEKVKHLEANPYLALLFYHPSKKAQIRVSAHATIHHQDETSSEYWESIKGNSRKDYGPLIAPGQPIRNPEEAHNWPDRIDDRYFVVLEVIPDSIEVLQLNKAEHLRALFTKEEGDWRKTWLAP
jgi:general stress protein 26